jgi:Domain of unknown function (DUF2017)
VAFRRQIRRGRGGEIRLRLRDDERELLRTLCAELRVRIEDDPADDDLRRLFPPAHTDDADADDDYRRLVGNQLVNGRTQALETVQRTADSDSLSPAEAEAWLTVLNDLRLVLGTRLDVTEEMSFDLDPSDPRTPELALYAYLSWLQEQLVEALALGFN